MTLYEYEHNALTDEWKPLDKKTWLSWSGRRRLNGREYHGPIFFLGTDEPVVRQARACPCDVCQQTNPWKVDAIEYREERDALRELNLELVKALENWITTIDGGVCPHGNSGRYPASAWFCDDCVQQARDALARVRKEGTE